MRNRSLDTWRLPLSRDRVILPEDGTTVRHRVSNAQEDMMDLWSALGVSREVGLIAVGIGVATALVLAGFIALRRRRSGAALGLLDR